MARWDIYNVLGDASPLLNYELESRDWDWEQQINPTPDVGLAFKTVVRSLSESEREWTAELFDLLGRNGGGRIIKYEGSSVDGSVTGYELYVNEDGEVERTRRWPGRIIDIYRVDSGTVYDRSEHNWSDVDDDLTIKAVPYSLRDVNGGRDPDPRFHRPLLKAVEEDTGLKTLYEGHWGHGWRVAGELPGCVYELKEVPEHIESRREE